MLVKIKLDLIAFTDRLRPPEKKLSIVACIRCKVGLLLAYRKRKEPREADMKIIEKIESMKRLSKDLEYLEGEYERVALWGSCPDGDVKFDKFMEWLSENDYLVEHMIKVANDMKELEK